MDTKDTSIPIVRIVIDGITESGRNLLRGVMRYARTSTRWHLRVEMDPHYTKGRDWEEDDATIYASHVRGLLLEVMNRKRHVVNCLAHHEALGLPTVRVNDYAVGEMAAKYFMEKGFERFLYFSGTDVAYAAELRYSGYAKTLLDAGYVVGGQSAPTRDPNVASHLIEEIRRLAKPLALLVSHDALARDLTDQLGSAGLLVPDQVAILGVDDDELQSEISRPPLSSIQIPYVDIGYRAASVLDAMLQGKTIETEPILIEPTAVVTRQSTAIFALNEPRLAEALRFIREHACDPCNVNDVLNHLAVSRRWLESQFRTRFSRTPHEAITMARMERAKQLLRDPDQTLKSIADKSGYGHVQNFVGAFRQEVGETPATYRRRMRLHRAQKNDAGNDDEREKE